MRILHIASFHGNFGDLFSHHTLYHYLHENLKNVSVRKKEIRDFYLNGSEPRGFAQFIKENIECYDYILIGGGGFLSPRKEYAENYSKCMIDICDDIIERYGFKFILVSLGYEGSDVSSQHDSILSQAVFLNKLHSNGAHIWLREDNGTDILRLSLDRKIHIGMDVSAFYPNQNK